MRIPIAGLSCLVALAAAAFACAPPPPAAAPAHQPSSAGSQLDQLISQASGQAAPPPAPAPGATTTAPLGSPSASSGNIAGNEAGTAGPLTIDATQAPQGTFLTDALGHALYVSSGDSPGTSNCNDACAQVWVPLLLPGGQPAQAGAGVQGSLLGTAQRPDGTTQATYDQLPLYTYVGDPVPGYASGDDTVSFGFTWHVVEPDGTQL